jgi:hypothetical protein
MSSRQLQNRRALFQARSNRGRRHEVAGPRSSTAVGSYYQIAGIRKGGKT